MPASQFYRDLMQMLFDIDGHSMAHSQGVVHGFFDARLDSLQRPGFRFGEPCALRIMEQAQTMQEDRDYLGGYFAGRREADDGPGGRHIAFEGRAL